MADTSLYALFDAEFARLCKQECFHSGECCAYPPDFIDDDGISHSPPHNASPTRSTPASPLRQSLSLTVSQLNASSQSLVRTKSVEQAKNNLVSFVEPNKAHPSPHTSDSSSDSNPNASSKSLGGQSSKEVRFAESKDDCNVSTSPSLTSASDGAPPPLERAPSGRNLRSFGSSHSITLPSLQRKTTASSETSSVTPSRQQSISPFPITHYIPRTETGLFHSVWSVKGRRDYMEDRHRILYNFAIEFSESPDSDCDPALIGSATVDGFFGVFDGHSGWVASQYASQFLPDCIFAHLQLHPAFVEYRHRLLSCNVPSALSMSGDLPDDDDNDDNDDIGDAIENKKLNQLAVPPMVEWREQLPVCISRGFDQLEVEVIEHSKQAGHDAGSTVVCAIVVDGCIYTTNCGDSRCVMARRLHPAPSTASGKLNPFGLYGALRPPIASRSRYPPSQPGVPVGAPEEALAAGAPPPPPKMHQPSSFGPLPELKDIKSLPPAPPPPSPHIKSKLHQPNDGFAEITFSDDSRVQVVDLSLDHKPGRLDERIRIQRAGSKVIATSHYQSMMCGLSEATIDGPLRVNPAGLSLSRSVGDATAKKALPGLDAGPVIHTPELTITQIDSDCLFMIIGTDGLWDVMTSAEAIDYVYRKVVIRKVPPQDVARKLVTKAIRMGSDDNCTALVVFFTQW